MHLSCTAVSFLMIMRERQLLLRTDAIQSPAWCSCPIHVHVPGGVLAFTWHMHVQVPGNVLALNPRIKGNPIAWGSASTALAPSGF